jgi:NurA domain.
MQEVYSELFKIFSKLNQVNDLTNLNSFREKINKIWKPLEGSHSKIKVTAVDGGKYSLSLRNCYIFIADACSVIYDGIEEKVIGSACGGILIPGIKGKKISSLIMQILELEEAKKAEGFALMDGSISTFMSKNELRDLDEEVFESGMNSKSFIQVTDILENKKDEKFILNYLLGYKYKLLKEIIDKDIIWISKNSRRKHMFKGMISDLAIIEVLKRERGYVEPLKRRIETIIGEKEIMDSIVKLESTGVPLRVEFISNNVSKFFKDLMLFLSSCSLRGYPYPLLRAHAEAHIERRKLNKIFESLGVMSENLPSFWPKQLS